MAVCTVKKNSELVKENKQKIKEEKIEGINRDNNPVFKAT